MSEALERHMMEKFTPEKLARMRRRIGIPARPTTVEPFNRVSSEDTIRHYVNGGGDDNPLFCDPEQAKTTRWGGVIAPITYLNTMGEKDPDTPAWTPEQAEAMGGGDPLRGIHAFMSGATWECYRPIRPNRRMLSRHALVGVIEKQSAFADRSVLLPSGRAYRDASVDGAPGDLIAWREVLMIHTERDTAAKKGKYAGIERPVYTPKEIAEIDEAYANEFRRGADILFWEDVEAGPLPLMVKGPLTVTDIIFWHQGGNERAYGLSPLRLAWKNRQRIPAFYLPNEFGAWDAAQRCHWDDALAQAVGNPFAYDYGAMREAWLVQYVNNWIGDDGWLWRFHGEMRRFNYIGDTTWIRGEVTGKREVDGGRFAVDLALRGENQRGETSTVGWATVLLPSRRHGAVKLPDPPEGVQTIHELFEAKVAAYRSGEQHAWPPPAAG
ncbi:MAG: MaoC family dehydratase N-terminal domain-containing protein [Caulobacteraceae bacterium]|nr:MaoC family dehydratase N-terminal domain-containing protein [Caulobacteraceae bacterium]